MSFSFTTTHTLRNVRTLEAFNFLSNFNFLTALTIVYFVRVTGSYTLGISLFSVIQITKALLELPTGIFSDTLGRRLCLIFGAVFSTLSVIFYAIGQVYWILVFGAIFQGASQAFSSGNNDALLYESLAENNQKDAYHDGLGKVRSNSELAWMIGGILGGLIANWSFAVMMWLSVIPQLLALAISFRFVEPTIHRDRITDLSSHFSEAIRLFRHNLQLRRLALADIINMGISEASWQLVSGFYNTLLPVWSVGLVISLNFLASVIGFRWSGPILKRISTIRLLLIDGVVGRCIRVVALSMPTLASPFLMALSGSLYGPVTVATNALMQDQVSDAQRATMSSLTSLLGSAFYAVCALLLGYSADTLGVAKTLLLAQFLTLPTLWLYVEFWRAGKTQTSS